MVPARPDPLTFCHPQTQLLGESIRMPSGAASNVMQSCFLQEGQVEYSLSFTSFPLHRQYELIVGRAQGFLSRLFLYAKKTIGLKCGCVRISRWVYLS